MSFTPDLAKAGTYELRLAYTPHANRASNVRVLVKHANGSQVVIVDQTRKPDQGAFHRLGRFTCAAGKQASVTVSAAGTDGYVVVDAVQFVLLP